ncbi:MAG TPA: uroporphyrinogen decarboxylase family protein [Candidatus Hydrogenedentes bacterium]|nr:uroporphyrinogen decarboxylase family protein [Candidatus Hydrogenedentota bacterium]
MAIMTKRERVMRTVRFEETDRVPLYDIFQNDAIIEHYAGRPLTYDDGAQTTALAVGRVLDMTRMVTGPQRPAEGVWGNGIRYKTERWTGWIVERPFRDLPTLIPWIQERIREANDRTFDRKYAEGVWKDIESKWADFAEADPTGRGDPTVLVIESGVGLDGMYHATGMQLFTELMMEQPDLLDEWMEALVSCELRRVAAIADPHHIPVALTYSDIAHKTGAIFSPDWLRTHWIHRLKRLNAAWHERGTTCIFHSDGNLWGVLDDLVEAGIDGLNPIEVLAGMTVKEVRAKYPHLLIAGGIDVSQLLTYGAPEEVRETCRQAIAATNARGFFMGSSTELHWDVRLEKATAMFETAWEMAKI